MTDYRLDIAALLRQGLTNSAIAQQLHCAPATVAKTRDAIGLPKAKRGYTGKVATSVEDLFYARTEPVDGGHLRWTGYVEDGLPRFRQGGHGGRRFSACRVAFKIRTGREPVGRPSPTCDFPGCVAPEHMDDAAAQRAEEEHQEQQRRHAEDIEDAKRARDKAQARYDQLRQDARSHRLQRQEQKRQQ